MAHPRKVSNAHDGSLQSRNVLEVRRRCSLPSASIVADQSSAVGHSCLDGSYSNLNFTNRHTDQGTTVIHYHKKGTIVQVWKNRRCHGFPLALQHRIICLPRLGSHTLQQCSCCPEMIYVMQRGRAIGRTEGTIGARAPSCNSLLDSTGIAVQGS